MGRTPYGKAYGRVCRVCRRRQGYDAYGPNGRVCETCRDSEAGPVRDYVCAVCGAQFQSRSTNAKYCCEEHLRLAQKINRINRKKAVHDVEARSPR